MKKKEHAKKKEHKKKKAIHMLIPFVLILAQLLMLAGCTNNGQEQNPADQSGTSQNVAADQSGTSQNVAADQSGTSQNIDVKITATNLTDEFTPQKVEPLDDLQEGNATVTDFAVRLMQASQNASEKKGPNLLISPLSVLYALAMTANGASGETLTQMETVLGMSTDELNQYLYSYMENLSKNETCKLNLANSIWVKEDYSVNDSFLQKNADYYGTDIYQASFDETTLADINNWVKVKTDEMIPEILDKIPEGAVMYLVNALAFDAEWNRIYEENEIRENNFTKEDGTVQKVEFMSTEENYYLEDENAKGFMKHYKGRDYAFVALLPNEGITVEEYVASLTGEYLSELLADCKNATVLTSVPKFETEYSTELSDVLKTMGMPNAFNGAVADFTELSTLQGMETYIGRVLHKTFISVDEKGTKAGAVTAVEFDSESETIYQNVKEVYLDRPFVYLLVDCENNIPFFIGTMMDVEG